MKTFLTIPFRIKSRTNPGAEAGIAMVTVLIMTTVLIVMAVGMYFVASKELTMSNADMEGSEAFYYAEGGLEAVVDIISTEAATEHQLTRPMADDSADGYGYLMDPTPAMRQNPSHPLEMTIGKDTYTVWVDTVDENGNPCTGCGLDVRTLEPAYLEINAEGRSGDGYRHLQQRVRVEASGFPLAFYIDGDLNANGTPIVSNQNIYVKGNVYGRGTIEVFGTDMVDGNEAAIFATGTIYERSNGGNSQIYTASGEPNGTYWSDSYINDRDSRGPAGNEYSLGTMMDTISTDGLTETQLETLKSLSRHRGFYAEVDGGVINVQQSDLPEHDGNVVVFVEFTSGDPADNMVDLKFTWPVANYGKALIVVLNGTAKMTGQAIGHLEGIVYCPDGVVEAHGSGNGDYTGFVFGKGLVNIGNFEFNMTEEFIEDAPFFAWTVTRETAWKEIDR